MVIQMDQVPKVIKPLVEKWAPEGFLVSFKVSHIRLTSLPIDIFFD